MCALQTYRIEVGLRARLLDAAGAAVKKNIGDDLGIPVKDVRMIRVYTILTDLSRKDVERLRADLFTDPRIERAPETADDDDGATKAQRHEEGRAGTE